MQNYNSKNKKAGVDMALVSKCLMTSLMAVAIYTAIATQAYAAGAAGAALCTYIGVEMGTGLGRAIATIGVLIVGVGAALGRMSWTTAITCAVGIAFMFSAGIVVQNLGRGAQGCFGN
jgi:type IV secretory pathway VirB2 component (pilin)